MFGLAHMYSPFCIVWHTLMYKPTEYEVIALFQTLDSPTVCGQLNLVTILTSEDPLQPSQLSTDVR